MGSFEYTYRCPDCLRERSSYSIGATRHAECPDKKGSSPAYWVLVAIDGDDVSTPSDPQPKENSD